MTMTNKHKVLFSLVAVLALAALPVVAQDEGHSAGGATVSGQGGDGLNDSSKLEQYGEIPEGVFVPDFWYSYSKGKFYLDVDGTNPGLNDQFLSLDTGKKDAFNLRITWDENPNWMSNTARTPYTEVSPGVFKVPDGMQLALQNIYAPWTGSAPANPLNPNFYALEGWVANGFPVDLGYQRKTGKGDLAFKLGKSGTLNLVYSREQRDGNKNTTFYGGPDFEVATPINYTTDDFKVAFDWAKNNFFANASVDFNQFTNDVPFVEIDNTQRLQLTNPTTGAKVINDSDYFRLWMAPDNKANSFDLTGGVLLAKKHKLTASLSTGTMKADWNTLPISTNPNLQTNPANPNFTIIPPYGNIEAKFDHFMGQVKLAGDFTDRFGYILSWRKFELDDKTEEYRFTSTVRGDVGASYSAAGFTREAEGYGTESLRGELHVLLAKGLRLGASYGQDKRTYDAREYEDVEDDVFILTGDYNYDWANLHLAWTNLDRKPGSGNAEAIQPTWQGATQTDITERSRHNLSAIFTLMPTSKFNVALTGAKQSNDFAESVTGLLDQTFDSFGVDFTFVPSDRMSFGAGYVYEKYYFNMAAAYFPRGVTVPPNFNPKADPNYWENATEDKIDSFRVSFDWVLVPAKWDFDANFQYSKPRSDSNYTFVAGGAGEANGVWPATPVPGFPVAGTSVPTTFTGFPQVSKEFYILKAQLAYHIQKNLTASLLYWKQKYDNIDWQTQTEPYMGKVDPGSNRWFFLGAQLPSYDANILRASLTYTF